MLAWRANAQSQVTMMNKIILLINKSGVKLLLFQQTELSKCRKQCLFLLFKTRLNVLYSLSVPV